MEIKRYIAILQRWLWLIVLGVVGAAVAAYFISINQDPVYQTSARLLIDEGPSGNAGNEYTQLVFEQRLATTYVELIRLSTVLEETIVELDLPFGPNTLNNRLNVTVPRDTQLIVLTIEDEDPQQAALIANTLAEVFIRQNEERQLARFQQSIANWEEQVSQVREEMSDLDSQINTIGEPANAEEESLLSVLETSRREAEIRYTEAFRNLEALRVEAARGTNNVLLVEPARVPLEPIRPRPIINTVLSAVVGGMLALGFVFLVEYLDDSVKSPTQIEETFGASPLGAIATIRLENGEIEEDVSERLITYHTPRSPITEAYRVLRTNLSYSAIDEGLRTLLITSASPGEGKSTTSGNLAVVMAQTGQQVIVVDSDLRRPTQNVLFDLSNNHGLTTALLDSETPVCSYLQETGIDNLRVMTSGPVPPNPAELLNSQRMTQVIEELKGEADIVIFDTPPALTVADASIIAPRVNGSVIVAKVGETGLHALVQAAETLQKANSNLFGIVLNQVNVSRSGYYYRYYNYEYDQSSSRRRVLRLPDWLSGLSKNS